MEQEKTNQPKPRRASVTLRAKPLHVELNFTATAKLNTVPKPPAPKPPRPPFIDRNLKAGKFVLKEGAREAVWEIIKWLVSGRKREPAIAQQS